MLQLLVGAQFHEMKRNAVLGVDSSTGKAEFPPSYSILLRQFLHFGLTQMAHLAISVQWLS
jgi:hypothetical protein